ncbi:phage/plasmid primase, P4 family [Singulisphaera sp. Ch08]|uniref:Phage/plasmid primase, P4 family n=1 Tax=Singulisphaera sp. Ch08 TaxID=3120278 RepID=A0AAU7CNP9_9BACT
MPNDNSREDGASGGGGTLHPPSRNGFNRLSGEMAPPPQDNVVGPLRRMPPPVREGVVRPPLEIANPDNSAVILQLNELIQGAEVVHPDVRDDGAEAGPNALPTIHEANDDPHRLARLFRERQFHHVDGATLVHQGGEFLGWDGSRYKVVPDIKVDLNASIRAEFERINRQAIVDRGAPHIPKVQKFGTRLVNDALQALASITNIPHDQHRPSWLGAAEFPAAEVLACRNALLHLPSLLEERDGLLEEPDGLLEPTPRFFSTHALPYNLDPTAPRPAEWLRFLNQLWPEDPRAIEALQEWFGYCLTSDTSLQKILMIVGPSRSGKGTIARVLRGLIGPDSFVGSTLASLATNFGVEPLIDKMVAVFPDARISGRPDYGMVVERLLSISGEDHLTIDRKHRLAWSGRLPTRLLFLTNELPRLRDSSTALAGRFIILRLTHNFVGREDRGLTDRLLEELPGILLWAIEGWARLNTRGRFDPPPSGDDLTRELANLSSPMRQFLDETCVVETGQWVPVDVLWGLWQQWCQDQGRDFTGDKTSFGRDLRTVVPDLENTSRRDRGRQVRVYLGLRLRSTPRQPGPPAMDPGS